VGGTSLSFNGSTRTETVWSYSGGGTSAYTTVPAYQTALSKTITKRRVADVSLDSDPYTGQYVGITVPGRAFGFMSGGGTSIAAPEWAGLLAIASAQRALVKLPVLTSVQNALYLNILPNANSYAQAFLDVTKGANGSCATCAAAKGYDASTGLGTPNSSALLALLSTIKQ
jgi:subtilase family serine protease